MEGISNFQEKSYQIHENHYALNNGELNDLQRSWFRNDTVDFWRHQRMYAPLSPILKHIPGSSWLTVGDGRFGLDSINLKRIEPTLDILPVDISTEFLEYARNKGMIIKYAKENAEKLSFADYSFDFAFCKESFHHFPRPYIALYEMLRVAKQAVILIEPNDNYRLPLSGSIWQGAKNLVKKILNKKILPYDTWNFEEVGNYIYTLSRREMEKVALGLNLSTIAVHYFNDIYINGTEFENASDDSAMFKKIKKGIKDWDSDAKSGIKGYKNITVIIFKAEPPEQLCKELTENNFEIIRLPKNPYIK